ncbi:nickel pincer cofactor biosynthesis protein LarB [Salinirubellus salinus]|uniref:Nickel pincer cofactor biosynthesis protein LarB n=1 Tax=Salinirubellus salinus TaxID=1364945 RepID=A0A9E7R7X6_9EURY|nr:nickel pincer cofactor biosynthesis protein LarB [Salinirubellus salinus]UWM56878.1 nickel pincer cofactor biosynthesis protein LarB [Salinirubellus salinus]
MRGVLEAVAEGELSAAAAEAALGGYVTGEAGRFDAARESRSGVPEAVLADGKTTAETAALAADALETTGHALVTRADEATAAAVRSAAEEHDPAVGVEYDPRALTVVVHAPDYEPPELDGVVGVVTAGTSDAMPAGEAAAVVREMGLEVRRVDDVGVAGIARLFDALPALREMDVLVVAAGREGALPTVLAGLVDVPLVGLPVSNGYGAGGDGEAALVGMLQSCTALSVVNVDAGFTAGAQAGLVARGVARARDVSEV